MQLADKMYPFELCWQWIYSNNRKTKINSNLSWQCVCSTKTENISFTKMNLRTIVIVIQKHKKRERKIHKTLNSFIVLIVKFEQFLLFGGIHFNVNFIHNKDYTILCNTVFNIFCGDQVKKQLKEALMQYLTKRHDVYTPKRFSKKIMLPQRRK